MQLPCLGSQPRLCEGPCRGIGLNEVTVLGSLLEEKKGLAEVSIIKSTLSLPNVEMTITIEVVNREKDCHIQVV